MKTVLLISYFFPPDGGAGTQRAAKFAKYLTTFGWQPIVLTRTPPGHRSRWDPVDETLQNDKYSFEVIRVADDAATAPWDTRVTKGELGLRWIAPAWKRAKAVVQSKHVDACFVTMSPFALSTLGLRIQHELGIPTILDLRDPWALDGWRVYGSKCQWRRDLDLMGDAVHSAAHTVANTPEARNVILRTWPGLDTTSVSVIPNGFDHDDFDATTGGRPYEGVFRITHTGTFHTTRWYRERGLVGALRRLKSFRAEPMDISGRTPVYLLRALEQMAASGHPIGDELEIDFVGVPDPGTQRLVRRCSVRDRISIHGYCSHRESIKRLCRSSLLFLPLHAYRDQRRSLITPGKTYEYLKANTPILGCLPEGDARDLVRHAGGHLARPTSTREIAAAIDDAFTRRHDSRPPSPSWLAQYERRHLAGQLAEVFDHVTHRAKPSLGLAPAL